ncbi:MAG: diguanylate cyclase [Clostridia bacterium]|nr:diguanylate cyclase [Clostridia bacterium]
MQGVGLAEPCGYYELACHRVKASFFSQSQEQFSIVLEDITGETNPEKAYDREPQAEESEFLRELAASAEVIFFIREHDRFLYISPYYETVSGKTRQSLYDDAKSCILLIHPDDRELLISSLRNEDSETCYSEEFRVCLPGGSVRWFWLRSFPVGGGTKRKAGVITDISGVMLIEEALHEEKERLETTLQSIGDGVVCTDSQGVIERMNRAAEKISGWKDSEAVGRQLDDVMAIYDELTGERCETPIKNVIRAGRSEELTSHKLLRLKDGSMCSIADSAAPIIDKGGNVLGAVLVFRDVTDERRRYEEINYLSSHDQMTGLFNRSFLEHEMERIDRSGVCPISIIMGDVNGLKMVNDVFGHGQGDHLLKVIGEIIKNSVRKCDLVARSGGDEFVIILPEADSKTASLICDRIYKACKDYPEEVSEDPHTYPGISLGFSTKECTVSNLENTLKSAEMHMYSHKLIESRHTHSSIISSMRRSLSESSNETELHINRLRLMCKEIAIEMGLNEKDRSDLDVFAMLHDIGKITIDTALLRKPGSLNAKEWEEIRKHPETGFRIANSAPEIAHISEYILTHHENWDGTGYPQALSGTEIPLLSRILSVADAYVTMTNVRFYHKAVSSREAAEEIKIGAGKKYDPQVVAAFERVIARADI